MDFIQFSFNNFCSVYALFARTYVKNIKNSKNNRKNNPKKKEKNIKQTEIVSTEIIPNARRRLCLKKYGVKFAIATTTKTFATTKETQHILQTYGKIITSIDLRHGN